MNISKYIIPVLVIVALFGGYALRAAFTRPTTTVTLGSGDGKKLECIVSGVKCKGTAQFFTSRFEGVDGINGIETFAADHRVVFTYDPDVIAPENIRASIDAPVLLNDGSWAEIFQCLSMEEK